jgi:hypothetical protein
VPQQYLQRFQPIRSLPNSSSSLVHDKPTKPSRHTLQSLIPSPSTLHPEKLDPGPRIAQPLRHFSPSAPCQFPVDGHLSIHSTSTPLTTCIRLALTRPRPTAPWPFFCLKPLQSQLATFNTHPLTIQPSRPVNGFFTNQVARKGVHSPCLITQHRHEPSCTTS